MHLGVVVVGLGELGFELREPFFTFLDRLLDEDDVVAQLCPFVGSFGADIALRDDVLDVLDFGESVVDVGHESHEAVFLGEGSCERVTEDLVD